MNILQIYHIGEMPVGTLDNIYDNYKTRGDEFVYNRMLDYAHFQFLETLWNEPRISLKSYLK